MKEQENKTFAEKAFGRLLSVTFALCWLMIVFKAFHIGWMKSLSWWTVLFPLLFFMLTSIGYIIIKFACFKWLVYKPRPLTPEEIRMNKRRGHLADKPTKMKTQMKKAFLWVLCAILSYLILNLFR